MRKDPILEEYCSSANQYKKMGRPVPESLTNSYIVRRQIDEAQRLLWDFASGNAIPKSGWQWIKNVIDSTIPDNISKNLMNAAELIINIIVSLDEDLRQNPEAYLIDGFTLTKKGRIRIRCASNEIKSICKMLKV